MTKTKQRFAQAAALTVAILFLALGIPLSAFAAGTDSPQPAWTVSGTRWDAQAGSITPSEADRFAHLWTARFLDSPGLEAYLNRPGLYDDGFNDATPEEQAFLVVHLIRHWQAAFGSFGEGFWTGDPVEDQKKFQELASMVHVTIFAKDEFLANLRGAFPAQPDAPPVDEPADAGIEAFPGLSQSQITAYFDALHEEERQLGEVPTLPEVDVSAHLEGGVLETIAAPPAASIPQVVDLAVEMTQDVAFPSLQPEPQALELLPRHRREAAVRDPTPIPDPTTVAPPGLLDGILQRVTDVPSQLTADVTDNPTALLNLLDAGTYTACSRHASGLETCLPTPVPLGTPVGLDVDGDVLTGAGGQDVLVHLTPTIHPDHALTGFAVSLSATRTVPSTVATSAPLPAEVYVVYRAAAAGVQVLAGFDGREDTLADSHQVRVTVKDVALALAGDVQILTEVTQEGPGATMSLVAGFSQVDASAFPAVVTDPTVARIRFSPAPTNLVVDLRFNDVGAQTVIEGHVTSSATTTVTSVIVMEKGASYRRMEATIEDLPTQLDFRVVSEAVGAVDVAYDANAGFPRFEFSDVLVPDVTDMSTRTTLDAVVLDIPEDLRFLIGRPFDVAYEASGRVGEATVLVQRHDADGLLQSFYGSVEGIPSAWSLAGTDAPFTLTYAADGPVDVLNAGMYDRVEALSLAAHAEAIPDGLDVILEEGHVRAETSAPVGLLEARASLQGVTTPMLPGEFASYASDGAGGLAAAARVAGFTSFDLDSRTGNLVTVSTSIAGGEPFRVLVDDPAAYVSGTLSNLPTQFDLALRPSSFTYDLAQPITQIDLHAEIGTLVADARVTGLPDQLTLSWTPTSLTWDANAAVTGLGIQLEQGNLVAAVNVTGIPADFTVAWPSGTASFTSPGAIGRVKVAASIGGGTVYALGGDHFAASKSGSAIGVGLQLSGIRSFSADPRDGGAYSLGLSPGGQPFHAYATLDGSLVQAYVSSLPQTIGIDLDASASRFGYSGSAPIADVWAYASMTSGVEAYVDFDQLPSTVAVSWALGTAPVVTYEASSTLGRVYAHLKDAGGALYQASLTSLPPYVRVSVAPDAFLVDARESSASASGTGTIGAISGKYGSDGASLGGTGNHANFYQRPGLTRASFGYSGLQYAEVRQAADDLVVDLKNSAPRYFTAYADTPEALASLTIDSIPAHVRVTGVGTSFTYDAYGQAIGLVSTYFSDLEGTTVNASVRGIPDYAAINANLPAKTIAYSATSAIGGIDVDAWTGPWYAKLRLANVPTSWVATFANGNYLFDAGTSSIGSLEAVVTNHGTWTSLSGNHLNVNYVQAGDVIDASLRMTQVQKASYQKVGANSNIDLRMGGGTSFVARADLGFTNGDEAYMYASFLPLPASIQASFGQGTTISTSQNFDLYAYAEFGRAAALAATPTPLYTHGVSVRDGASGSNRAVKTQLYLTGLPTSVSFNGATNTFSFANWRPKYTWLLADAELDNLVSTPIDGYVYLTGIPSPQSLTFAMTAESLAGGVKRTKVDLTQTAAMGALYADLVYGANHGRLQVSNIPDDIHSTLTLANGASTFTWDATAAINSVYAAFRVPSQSTSFQGYVSLTDLPADFGLTFGRASGGQGPTLTYSASASTLDVNAYVDASLFGGDLKARLSFGLTNLGATTNVYASGSGVRFTSSPATATMFANVWGTYNYYRQASGVWNDGSWIEFPWAYHLGVNPNVNNLAVTLSSFSDFSLAWGVTSKLSGSYGTFSFGWSSMSVGLDVYGKVQIVVDWPWPFGSSTITLVDYHLHQTVPVNVLFHKYTNHQGAWFSTSGWAICDWTLSTSIRPHPHGSSWNGATTSASTAEGGAWYVTPNPYGWVPSWAIDLAARYTSPDGGSGPGLSFSYDC